MTIDPATIIAITSLLVAIASAIVALEGARTARESLVQSRQQDARRGPRIVAYLANGFARRDPDRRLYAVSLSVSNPADADNSIALLELELRYRISDGLVMTMRLAHDPRLGDELGRPGMQALNPPVAIAAHGTVAGWGYFALPKAATGDAEIEDYVIRLIDAHGIAATIDFGPVREISDDTQVG